MTVTLHWWMVPLAIILTGVVIAWCHEDQGGWLPDFTKAFVLIGAIGIAVVLCIGHFL